MSKNLTPEHLRCPYADCPSIRRLDDGRLLVTGELVEIIESVARAAGHTVKSAEATILISPDLLADYVAEQSAWRPISTAPKDGTQVLIRGTAHSMLVEDPITAVARWSQGWWGNFRGAPVYTKATHWQPLPLPPQVRGSDEEAQSADEVSAADQPASLTQKDSTND